jgi:hypothetical protein
MSNRRRKAERAQQRRQQRESGQRPAPHIEHAPPSPRLSVPQAGIRDFGEGTTIAHNLVVGYDIGVEIMPDSRGARLDRNVVVQSLADVEPLLAQLLDRARAIPDDESRAQVIRQVESVRRAESVPSRREALHRLVALIADYTTLSQIGIALARFFGLPL